MEFFFDPMGPVLQSMSTGQSLWSQAPRHRELRLPFVEITLGPQKINTEIQVREYLVLLTNIGKILDLRNLYVNRFNANSLTLMQKRLMLTFRFAKDSFMTQFMEIARRYIIRYDMENNYRFNLNHNGDRVGTGGFGDVRLIEHRISKITFALKSIRKRRIKNRRSSANSIRYMTNEINYLRILSHPNMLEFEEMYEDKEYIHIITELLNGGTVSDKKNKKMSVYKSCFVLKSILELLVYLEKKCIAHRDIKPGNIMFHETEDKKMVVKLIDFGLCADTTDKSDTTLLKDRAGTVCYLAPELIECNPKKGYYGPKVDVFSIAMVFWELLTGKNPIRVPRRRGEPRSKSKEYRLNMISNRDCELDYSKLHKFDNSIQDLMYRISTKDPNRRMAAKDVLRHRVFRDLKLVEPKKRVKSVEKKHANKASNFESEKIAAAYKSEAPKVPHLNLNKIGSKQSLTKQGSLGKKNAMSERGLLKPGSMNNLEQQHLYVDPKNTHQAPKTTQRLRGLESRGKTQPRGWVGSGQNRNYQSTGRVISKKEPEINHHLYGNRNLGNSENPIQTNDMMNQGRRKWDSQTERQPKAEERYKSVRKKFRQQMDGSLAPNKDEKRGMSVLNKDKNMYVRDVSERVKKPVFNRFGQAEEKKNFNLPVKKKENDGEKNLETEDVEDKKSKKEREDKKKDDKEEKTKPKKKIPKDSRVQRLQRKKVTSSNEDNKADNPPTSKAQRDKSKKESLKYLKRRKKNKKSKKSEHRKSSKTKEAKEKTEETKKENTLRSSQNKKNESSLLSGKKSRKRKKKSRKISEPLIKSKKKKSVSRAKRRIGMSDDEHNGDSIYTDPRNRNRLKERRHLRDKKEAKEKTKKKNRKASRSKEALGKLKQITKKKSRGKARSKVKKGGMKRYASVNTSKNPLLEMNLDKIDPRNTMKASLKETAAKNQGKKSYNFQEIQTTGLLAYQSNQERGNAIGRKRTFPKAEQPSLYQRQNSRDGSSVEAPDNGVYKNLYSGKHERNILEISSKMKDKPKTNHKFKIKKNSRKKLILDESISLDEEMEDPKIETSAEERPSNLLRDYMRNMEKKSQTPRIAGNKKSITASKNMLIAQQRRKKEPLANPKNIRIDFEALRKQKALKIDPVLSSRADEPDNYGGMGRLAASGIPLSSRAGHPMAHSGTLTKHKSQSRKEKQKNKALRDRFKKKEMEKWRQDVFLKYKKSWGPQMMSPHAFQPDSYNESDLNGLYQSNKVDRGIGGVSSSRLSKPGIGFNYNTERSGKFASNYSKDSRANMKPRYTAEELGSVKNDNNYYTQSRNLFKGSDLMMPGISNKKKLRLNRKQNLDLFNSRDVTGKDFQLKYLTRHRESLKEAQTDRKIEYGKKREHPKLKNSFKTNSQAGLARSGLRLITRHQGKPQMLKNMYNRKNTRANKKNHFLETLKHSDSNRNTKKNFVVASGGNSGLDTNFILGHPSPHLASKMMVSGRAMKGSHRNTRTHNRTGLSLGKKMYASPMEKKILLKMESLRGKASRRLHQSGLEGDSQRRLPARGLQGMHKGLFSGGMRKGFHGEKNSHHFKKQSATTLGFKGLTKSYNFSNPGLFKKNSFKQEN